MSEHDWSRLLKYQDEYTHQQDKKQQERQQRIKQIYKQELQKMIHEHQINAKNQKQYDKKLVNSAFQRDQIRIRQQQQQMILKAKIKQRMARENLERTANKRQRSFQEYKQQQNFYNSRFKKALTEAEEENKQKAKYRQHEKQQLSKAYESQILLQRNRKALEKLEDEKFTKLRQQIQRKKQQNRREYFQRIRNNYRQNPQVYQQSANILMKQQRQRSNFLQKLQSSQSKSIEQLQKQRLMTKKEQQVKQTSMFNKRYFESKALRERYQSLQQIADYATKYKTLQNQLQHEKQQHLKQQQHRRQILKLQLQKQIDQSHIRENLKKKMNDKQYLLNKSTHIPALPGLSRDFSSEKQHRILENFLVGRSEKKLSQYH